MIAATLVIPTYNRGNLIRQTVLSALAQDVAFTELIVVDDGSTDDTAEVLAEFGESVRVIRTENRGVQAARNTGVSAANTEFIVLCDSDDLLAPDYVAGASACIAAVPDTDVMYVNFVTFSKNSESAEKLASAPKGFFSGAQDCGDFVFGVPDLYLRSLKFQAFFPSGSLLRKRVYEALGGYDEKFRGVGAEDWEFTLRVLARANVTYCKKPLAKLRRHEYNDSADNLHMRLGEIFILEHVLREGLPQEDWTPVVQEQIALRSLDAFSLAFARGDLVNARKIAQKCSDHWFKSPKFILKLAICRLPLVLGERVWQLSQSISGQKR